MSKSDTQKGITLQDPQSRIILSLSSNLRSTKFYRDTRTSPIVASTDMSWTVFHMTLVDHSAADDGKCRHAWVGDIMSSFEGWAEFHPWLRKWQADIAKRDLNIVLTNRDVFKDVEVIMRIAYGRSRVITTITIYSDDRLGNRS